MTQGFVYLCGYKQVVKIGQSIEPSKRMSALNTANPEEVELYVAIPALDRDLLETKLHKYFQDVHIKGEWYQLTSEMHYLITEIRKIHKPTEFDIGIILGSYSHHMAWHLHNKASEENRRLKWRDAQLELVKRKNWAIEYAVRVLGLNQYPIFTQKVAEAQTLLADLPDGQAPMFIQDKQGNVTIGIPKECDPLFDSIEGEYE